MTSKHYVVKCRECDRTVSQCRCPALDKEVRWVTCDDCPQEAVASNELLPTRENLEDPYVLQLIEALSRTEDEVESLSAKLDSAWADSHAWEASANSYKEEAARLQLVAGRYQFMWEAAQLCLNKIDDWFEYAHKICTPEQSQAHVRQHLAIYTEAVSKPKAQIGK